MLVAEDDDGPAALAVERGRHMLDCGLDDLDYLGVWHRRRVRDGGDGPAVLWKVEFSLLKEQGDGESPEGRTLTAWKKGSEPRWGPSLPMFSTLWGVAGTVTVKKEILR